MSIGPAALGIGGWAGIEASRTNSLRSRVVVVVPMVRLERHLMAPELVVAEAALAMAW